MKIEPAWNKKVELTEGGGRDPLGLSRLSDFITLELLPGLISLTRRARYYSFYTWAIKTINKNSIVGRRDFYKKMNKLETAWVIGCILDKDESHPKEKDPIGNNKARRIIERSDDEINVNLSLFSNIGGVYQQYYINPMRQLGLIFRVEEKDVLTNYGKKLAKFFEHNIMNTEYYSKYIGKDVVPRETLKEYGEASNYLTLKETEKEKMYLIDLLFDDNQNLDCEYESSRKDTLLLHLDLYKKFSERNYHYTKDDFRNVIYYEESLKEDSLITYDPSNKSIQNILLFWKHFQFHDYFTFGLETLLTQFIQATKKETGTTKNEFIEDFNNIDEIIQHYLDVYKDDIKVIDIIDQIMVLCDLDRGLNKENSKKFETKTNIDDDFSEAILKEKINDADNSEEKMAYNLLLLIICIIRYYQFLDNYDENLLWLKSKEAEELSLYTYIGELRGKIETMTIKDFLKTTLIKVINKHDLIAWEKRESGRETFRFKKYDDRYIFERNYNYRQRGGRFVTIRHFFEDLGLIVERDEGFMITEFGKEILERYIND